MSDVNRLLERLRELGETLVRFDMAMEEDFRALDVAWSRLDKVWGGDAREEFTRQWRQTSDMFRQYTSTARKYEIFLDERIRALGDFERGRF